MKGWLPLGYPETQTRRFFRQNFAGEHFILASEDGCTMADPRLEMGAKKMIPPPEGRGAEVPVRNGGFLFERRPRLHWLEGADPDVAELHRVAVILDRDR